MPSLAQTLDQIRETGAAKRDPSINQALRQSTADLAATGIVRRAVQVGDRAPMFARPNVEHETVRLDRVLQRGPAVVSFFRGRW